MKIGRMGTGTGIIIDDDKDDEAKTRTGTREIAAADENGHEDNRRQ